MDEPLDPTKPLRIEAEATVPEATPTVADDGAAPVFAPLTEGPGTVIGHYKLLQKIGEGGFGVVYMAEQQEPVRRRVALKVIKLGMDTKAVIARFEAERQALALMDHPNVAKVLDAGTTATGRPYFVMELVKGIRITDYCDQNNLATTERLGLFMQVCHAIQHAHQKGIIHRDIKPSNILVTLHDGVPVPKVIDFGIAKATTDQRLTDKTLFTAFEQFLGTPAYMSPEQAEQSGLDIDTRSDIYALGVLLYELLTGHTPFDSKRLVKAGLAEIRRIIREEEPPRPSTRISTLTGDEQTTIAKHRQSEPPKLRGIIRGDLDWIVMKTLEKDRTRRYESSSGLAADIQRYLSNEPVVARPPSRVYRMQKMVRRNKLAFGAAATVLAALFIGLTASTWWGIQANRARRAEVRQRQQADLARQQAETAERAAANERARAENKELEIRLTMSSTDFRLATHLVDEDRSPDALAYLARSLRGNRTNSAAATRLCSLLTYRRWALPVARITCTNTISEAHFSPDAKRVATLSAGSLQMWNALTGEVMFGPLQEAQPIQSVVFSPNGTQIATVVGGVGGINDVQVRDAKTGVLQWGPLGQDRKAYYAHFSPNGQYLLTVSFHSAWVWDAKTGSRVAGPLPHDDVFLKPMFNQDETQLLTAVVSNYFVLDGRILVWDVRTGQPLAKPMPHPQRITSAQFSPDGRQIVTALACDIRRPADGGNHVRVWDANSGQLLVGPTTVTNFHGEISADGQALLMSSGDAVGILRVPTGEIATHPLRESYAASVACFSRDGKQFLTNCRRDKTVRVWATTTGDPLTEPMKHTQDVTLQEFSDDGSRVFTVSGDTLTIWDTRHATALSQPLKHGAVVNSARFSPDGERVITASEDRTARVWDAATGQVLVPALQQPKYGVHSAHFDSDGRRVITLSGGTVQIWDARTGQMLGKSLEHTNRVVTAAFSPDGNRVITATASGLAQLWDAKTGEPLGDPLKDKGFDLEAEFSPDGARILTTGRGTRIWDAHSGRLLLEIAGDAEVGEAHFSPDGQNILTAERGDNSVDMTVVPGVVHVWNSTTGRQQTKPMNHAAVISSAHFSPDGQRIVTTSRNYVALVWDVRTGESLSEPMKHGAEVSFAQFSPDGQRIVTASGDGTARVWDAQTGQPLTDPMQCGTPVVSAEFSPNGQRIVAASGDSTARVWDIAPSPERPPDWLLDMAEAVATQALNGHGLMVPADGVETLKQIREKLSQQPGNNPWELWGHWFLADPHSRTISPFSKVTIGK